MSTKQGQGQNARRIVQEYQAEKNRLNTEGKTMNQRTSQMFQKRLRSAKQNDVLLSRATKRAADIRAALEKEAQESRGSYVSLSSDDTTDSDEEAERELDEMMEQEQAVAAAQSAMAMGQAAVDEETVDLRELVENKGLSRPPGPPKTLEQKKKEQGKRCGLFGCGGSRKRHRPKKRHTRRRTRRRTRHRNKHRNKKSRKGTAAGTNKRRTRRRNKRKRRGRKSRKKH